MRTGDIDDFLDKKSSIFLIYSYISIVYILIYSKSSIRTRSAAVSQPIHGTCASGVTLNTAPARRLSSPLLAAPLLPRSPPALSGRLTFARATRVTTQLFLKSQDRVLKFPTLSLISQGCLAKIPISIPRPKVLKIRFHIVYTLSLSHCYVRVSQLFLYVHLIAICIPDEDIIHPIRYSFIRHAGRGSGELSWLA